MNRTYHCPICDGLFNTTDHPCAGIGGKWQTLLDAQEIVEAQQQAQAEFRVASDYQPKKVSE